MTSQHATSRPPIEQSESPAPSGRLLLMAAGASALWVAVWIGIQLSDRLS